jgi:nucleotidyltransferase substrate binding protein (TIGR01987 family)
MPIILSSLDKAITSLQKAINRSLREPDDEEVRDAVIQRFEYTYELCVKLLKRRLEADASSQAAIDLLSYKDLIRLGAESGYLYTVENWFKYREYRNQTVHIYDEQIAAQVYNQILGFVTDAKLLYENLILGDND